MAIPRLCRHCADSTFLDATALHTIQSKLYVIFKVDSVHKSSQNVKIQH